MHLCGLWLVCAIMHINIKFGRPSHKTMTDVLRHCFVLFQFLEENILVEVTNILEVCKYHRFLCDGRLFETQHILAENIFSQKSRMLLIAAIMVVIIIIV